MERNGKNKPEKKETVFEVNKIGKDEKDKREYFCSSLSDVGLFYFQVSIESFCRFVGGAKY